MSIITQSQLSWLERALDNLWSGLGVDIEFTQHFLERVNDARNGLQITLGELQAIFTKVYKRFGEKISHIKRDDFEAVLTDLGTNINIPFVLKHNGNELELVSKTIMRKKNFMTSGQKFQVEGAMKSFKEFKEENDVVDAETKVEDAATDALNRMALASKGIDAAIKGKTGNAKAEYDKMQKSYSDFLNTIMS